MRDTEAVEKDHLAELSALYEISSIPTSLISLEKLSDLVLDKATRLLGAPLALLYHCEGDERFLRFWAARGVAGAEALSPDGEAMAQMLDKGQITILEGADAVRSLGLLPDSYNARHGVCVPIHAGESVRALLCAFRRTDRPFTRGDQSLFNVLAERTGTALESIRLFDDLENRTLQLQTAAEVSRAASGIIDPDKLIQQVVDLVRERFELYFVGLFLVDGPGEWAVLQAGTGEAGRQMVEQGHRLEVDGESMVGWSVAHRQARIALDVGREAVRFDNPLLPETRSELALPLISRGEAIGALTVQSTAEAAFSSEDIATLQTMAEQLANAIANAQLLSLTDRARAETDKRVQELDCLNDIGHRMGTSPPVPELLSWMTARIPAAMQYSSHCVVAIEYQGQTFGVSEAKTSSWQMVQSLVTGNGAGGRIYVAYTQEHDFLDEESALLGDVARRISGYIENQQLLQETQARAAELVVLNEMSRALTTVRETEVVIESLHDYVSRLMDTANFYVALCGPKAEEVSFPLAMERGKRVQWRSRKSGQGLTEHVIRSREPLLITENVGAWLAELGVEMIGTEAESWLGVPLIVGGSVIGMIAVQSYTAGRRYDERHRDLLVAVAGQAAIAIQNARLFEETQTRAEELAVLNDLAQALTARLDVDQVLEASYRGVSRLLDATNFFIGLYDAERHEVTYPINVTESVIDREISILPAKQGISGYIIRHRTSVLIEDEVGKWEAEHGIDSVGEKAHSWLGVPLMLGDQMLGVMAVQSYTESRLYNEHDRDMLVAIANQTAIAIQNAQLFEGALASERRLQQQIAQQSVLNEIGQAVSQMTELELLLETVYQQIQRVMQVDAFFLALYDESTEMVSYPITYDEGQRYYESDAPLSPGGMLRQVVESGDPLLVNRTPEEVDAVVLTPRTAMGNVQKPSASLLYAPLRIGPRTVGGLSVQSYNFDAYDEGDMTLLAGVANQVAIALENVRLFEQAQARAEQERRVRTITDRIRQGADREAIMRIAARELAQMLGASKSVVRLGTREQLSAEHLGSSAGRRAGPSAELTGGPGDNPGEGLLSSQEVSTGKVEDV